MKRRIACVVLFSTVTLAVFAADAPQQPEFQRAGWNAAAKQRFMHPPVLTYTSVKDAEKYRCTITFTAPQREVFSLESTAPEFDLAPIWNDLPDIETFQVKAEALCSDNRALGVCVSTCIKMASFKGQGLPAKCGYAESATQAVQWVLEQKPAAYVDSFPVLIFSAYIRLFCTYAQLYPQSPSAKACVTAATEYAQSLLKNTTPSDWVYANLPLSHLRYEPHGLATDPNVSLAPDQYVLQVSRCAMAGIAYLRLYAVTQDKTWLDAALRIAETLQKTQLPEGRWPFRVNPRDGSVVIDYTSDQAEVILFLDELIRSHNRDELKATQKKAVTWMLENPCKTFRWEQQWDDMGVFPPYKNLDFYGTALFVEYLLRDATPENGYEKMAKVLMNYIDDHFVEWEGVPTFVEWDYMPNFLEWKGVSNQITPGVREQYMCYALIDWHGAHYMRACMNFYAKTKDESWLKKARALADTMTAVQHPAGYYPTWMDGEAKPGEPVKIGYKDVWPNCTSYVAEILLRLDTFLK